MWVTKVAMREMGQKSSQTNGEKFSCQMKGGVFTKFVRMFRSDDEEYNSVHELAALSGSISPSRCAMRARLSSLRWRP